MVGVQRKLQRLVIMYFAVSIAYLVLSATLGVLMIFDIISGVGLQAHAHIALLGFVSLTIMGAMYQIVPTLRGTVLFNPRLAEAQFWLMNIGVIGLSASFLMGRTLLLPPAVITAAATYLFVYIILATVWNVKTRLNLTIKFFVSALIYFSIATALGVALATEKLSQIVMFYRGNYLVSHVHLNLLAFVGLTIMGAMYQMLPMLSLRELYSPLIGEVQFWLINAGIIGFSIGTLGGIKELLPIFAVIVLMATYLFIYNMFRTIARKEGHFDISVKFFASALIYLTVACTLGVLITLFPGELIGVTGLLSAHAHLTSIGFVTLTIMGAMYHLVPMLVWMTRYSKKLGKEPVPAIAEMYDQSSANVQFAGANLGVAGYFLGLFVNSNLAVFSAIIFLISTYLFACIMYNIIIPWRQKCG